MLTKQQKEDMEKCEFEAERGNDVECVDCSCSVCIAQEDTFSVKDLIKESYSNAKKHGFWEDIEILDKLNVVKNGNWYKQFKNNAIGNRLMLITTEVAEAEDGLRKDDFNNFKEELADIVIRTCDLAGGLNIDLETEIIKKMKKNKERPYKHGKAF